VGLQDILLKKFIEMALSYIVDNLPRLKEELCDYSDEWAKQTENEWDDKGAELLRALLGVPK